jgi:hypothetical protein
LEAFAELINDFLDGREVRDDLCMQIHGPTRLRVVAGEPAQNMTFHFPSDIESFASPWEEVPGVLSAGLDFTIDASNLKLLDPDEILSVYERKDA